MVERLTLLRNIGQFDSIAPGAQLPFSKLTLIYAENGRGKTTLSAVLRSLATDDATLVNERRRLGAAHPPHVIVHVADGANHTFINGAWSAPMPTIAVFDDAFVAANVCSGLEIAAEHRQNLHELILGAQGVALNAALNYHVEAIEQHNRQLREKGNAILAAARGNLTVDQFCDLPALDDVVERVQDAERRLAAAQSAAAIQREPVFTALHLPPFDVGAINALLRRSLTDLDAAAAQQVQAHIARLGSRGDRQTGSPSVSAQRILQKVSKAASSPAENTSRRLMVRAFARSMKCVPLFLGIVIWRPAKLLDAMKRALETAGIEFGSKSVSGPIA